MPKQVTLTIDGRQVTVPEGTLIVDAAKMLGIDIPVFCYHPKMEPVGMCRMCLVDIGRPQIDRATGQPVKNEDGSPRIQFAPKLDTACTTPVTEGMVVLENTPKVQAARKEVLEFILTSHPLDCPICDKGGECPLQNLTMAYGPGQSRFLYEDKMHLAKHVALGELIYLDRERCIQCGRCVRFQHEIAGDPVIGFYQRGRSIEIVTHSEPGFDSIFSGNTTDICPVGALTTADFRFRARPWEMRSAASICSHCPVGCNIAFNVRREAKSAGRMVIKRAMPRQNEAVNELWMCDKGRFEYHFNESDKRILQPLVRRNDQLVAITWEEAIAEVASRLQASHPGLLTLAGGRLSNEDLFNLKQLTNARHGQAALYTHMGGGDLTALVGVGAGTNFSDMGKGSVILVVASDLHQEAPIWWLRVKQAVGRGATLIVANPRPTRLDVYAAHQVRYAYGDEVTTIQALMPGYSATLNPAAHALAQAGDAIILFGSEGLGLPGSTDLAKACAQLLQATGHVGKPNNGLIGVWPSANTQGAWDMGFRPVNDLAGALAKAGVVIVAAADPVGDDPALGEALDQAGFVVVQELFLTETVKHADVVLPVHDYTEREGTFTSGERRVQRYYPAVTHRSGIHADFAVSAMIGRSLGLDIEGRSALLVMNRIAAQVEDYAGISYPMLSEVAPQWPIIGRSDLYYGGTSYDNQQGLGVQLQPAAQRGVTYHLPEVGATPALKGALLAVPGTCLYDQGQMMVGSMLKQRSYAAAWWVNPAEAAQLGLQDGHPAALMLAGQVFTAPVVVNEGIPAGVVWVPRSTGLPLAGPAVVQFAPVPQG
jgi:NADH-quinone oxidoreductase subunit G